MKANINFLNTKNFNNLNKIHLNNYSFQNNKKLSNKYKSFSNKHNKIKIIKIKNIFNINFYSKVFLLITNCFLFLFFEYKLE